MTDDKKDPPIIPQDYIGGVTVIDFGEARISRGMSRRHYSTCNHRKLVYDQQERRIWCQDCERDVEHFDAFRIIVEQFAAAAANVKERQEKIAEAEAATIISRAAKNIDKEWRSRRMAPCCPHCKEALLPEFFANGIGNMCSAELARRKHGLPARPNTTSEP